MNPTTQPTGRYSDYDPNTDPTTVGFYNWFFYQVSAREGFWWGACVCVGGPDRFQRCPRDGLSVAGAHDSRPKPTHALKALLASTT